MAKLKSALTVSELQKLLLEKLAGRPSTSQHLVFRAKIVLFTYLGLPKAAIADQLGVDDKTVAWWRKRWISQQDRLVDFERNIPANQREDKVLMSKIVDVLSDAPRQGAPAKFTQEQVRQIVALACEAPEDVGVPMSHWTNEVLARELALRGIVESISSTRVWEILKKYGPPSP
jgi:putative transposase